jgi:CheY-like chemotaxis protein
VILPGEDGYAVCRKLAAANPRARIIVVTGDSRQVGRTGAGPFETLLKPVAIETLCQELNRQNPT